jgi:hypothetical protein
MADEQFKTAMKEWVTLKAQLSSARKDLQVLNKREKELREFVTEHMKTHEIDTVRVHEKVKVNLNTKNTKGGITKDVIKKGLLTYFGGDEVRTEGAFQAIVDAAPVATKSTVSVLGLKAMTE